MCAHQSGVLLLAYGEGGHYAQARRLVSELEMLGAAPRIVCLTDKAGISVTDRQGIVFKPLRRKSGTRITTIWQVASGVLNNAVCALKTAVVCVRAKAPVVLVSLGPAFVVIPAFVVRLFGGQVVHIETWSRFSSRSVTGRLMYPVAQYFFVQNEELRRLYPKALYCGRL